MGGSGRLRIGRLLVAAALGAAAVVAAAAPAAAHTVGGVDATTYRTEVGSVNPATEGLTVRSIDNGARLELTNSGRRDAVVEGYDGEPYLRVGPRGVYENARSPARFLNRVLRDPEAPPASADPDAPPEWVRVSTGTTARWHDHRAHWMGVEDPPIVRRAPDAEHLVQRFTIAVRVGDREVQVRGDVRYIPGPSPWPWIAGAAVLAIGTVIGARTRRAATVLGVVLVVAVVGAVVHAVGAWTGSSAALGKRGGDALPTLGAVALSVVALVQLRRRGLRAAAPLLVFAGLFLAIAIGLADVSTLSKSQLPTDLPDALDRLTVALALGGGAGVAVGAGLHVADRASTREGDPPVTENESHSMMQG